VGFGMKPEITPNKTIKTIILAQIKFSNPKIPKRFIWLNKKEDLEITFKASLSNK
jgi:hypothetical protein